MLSWTHPSPHPKRHLDRFSHFCTAHGRESRYFTMGRPFPLKIAPLYGEFGHHLIHYSLGPTHSASQIACWQFQPFLRSSLQRISILYNGPPLFPPTQSCSFLRGIWTPSHTWFLRPTQVQIQTPYRSIQPYLQGSRSWQTDRPTDRTTNRPCYSVCNSGPHLRT